MMNKDDLNKENLNKENHNEDDEKEIDGIFDNLKNTKLKKTIKKAKWHSILRIVVVSLLVIGVVMAGMVGGSILSRNMLQRMDGDIQMAVDDYNLISAPNKYIGEISRYHNVLAGRSEYTTYKIIEGKVVNTGDGQYYYGVFQNPFGNRFGVDYPRIFEPSFVSDDLEIQRYDTLGHREMVFFYPFINYPQYKNDLEIVKNMEPDKLAEIALSFDKAYSMDEVKNMLPNNVTLSWYWVDDLSPSEKKSYVAETKGDSKEKSYSARICSEQTAFGIKAYNNDGEPIVNPEQDVFRAIERGIKFGTMFKADFERVHNNIAGKDGKLTKDSIKVFGVVVTGNKDSLGTLAKLNFIKASSMGVVTDKY